MVECDDEAIACDGEDSSEEVFDFEDCEVFGLGGQLAFDGVAFEVSVLEEGSGSGEAAQVFNRSVLRQREDPLPSFDFCHSEM